MSFQKRIVLLLPVLISLSALGVWFRLEKESKAAGTCSTPSFAAVLTPNVGNSLNSLALADLNGDGKSDLVTTSNFEDKVSVLIGDGAGNFSLLNSFTTGARPSAVAIGDFNGDGKADLAVTRDFSTTVSVLLGNGTGVFSTPTNFTVGTNPKVLVLADFNNDGRLDLATGDDGSNTISILLGGGNGSFSSAAPLTGIRATSMAAADLNHDGKIDLAIANTANNKVTIVLGNGSGGFGGANSFDGGAQLKAIAVADFNEDGNPDVAVTNFSDSSTPAFVAILLGNGSGSFGAPNKFSVPFGPFSIAIADFNGDNHADVATANTQQTSSNIAVLLGDGAGNLSSPTNFNVGTTPTAVIAGDINGDGAPDLMATSPPNVAALLNGCGGAPTPTPTPTPTPSPTPTPVPTPGPGDVVISQVYAGAGNSDSSYQANFVELFNRTNAGIDIRGWPIYFTTPTGTFQSFVAFVGSQAIGIQAHGYLLIKFGPTGTSGQPVNSDFDATGLQSGISPAGKILLARTNSIPNSACPLPNTDIIDFVGYGSAASCFEGSGPTANPGNTTAVIRKFGGCLDTDNNASDFVIGSPVPHNSSSPTNSCANPIDTTDFFVRQQYLDFLNRQADASGLTFWKNNIDSCSPQAACIQPQRINTSAAFFLSIEFQQTGYLVYKIYKASFGNLTTPANAPVPIRLSEFTPDTQEVGNGVIVNQGDWQQQLENNKQAFHA